MDIPISRLSTLCGLSAPGGVGLGSQKASSSRSGLAVLVLSQHLISEEQDYLDRVEDRYATDAYNSLSIEGYQVTDELIARVASGEWSPELNESHKKDRDTLAARGYFQAFKSVKLSLESVLGGQNSGVLVSNDHHTWFAELFEPSVAAGILKQA